MKKYRVMLNGRNFRIALEGSVHKLGFYTTRWVEASDPKEAELQAVALVNSDTELRGAVKNASGDPPRIFLEEVAEVVDFEGIKAPGAGYSFYNEE